MVVKDVFYLTGDRMVFSGQFIKNEGVCLPIDVVVYVNNKVVGKIRLTTFLFSSGVNVRKDIDVIEASKKIDLKFVKWGQDKVVLKAVN